VLIRISKNLKDHNIELLVVYIPSKPEVYLPYVDKDLKLFQDYLTHPKKREYNKQSKMISNRLWRESLENRNNLEKLIEKFCESEQIPYLTLKPQLEELAAQGKLGFFSADTHWNEIGQSTAVQPIAQWLYKNLKN